VRIGSEDAQQQSQRGPLQAVGNLHHCGSPVGMTLHNQEFLNNL
jgi:hypothetical protein